MRRYFAPITLADLAARIEAAWVAHSDHDDGPIRYAYRDLTPQVRKDLAKVSFDFENCDDEPETYYAHSGQPQPEWVTRENAFMGYHTLPNGLTFRGVRAGGDWEWPVYFVLYWDGRKLRAYIPEDGNLWNTETHEAYGNDEEADARNVAKRFPGQSLDNLDTDCGRMLADVEERIQARERTVQL